MNKKTKRKTKRNYTKRNYTKRKTKRKTKRNYTKRNYTKQKQKQKQKQKHIINNLPNAKGVPLFSSQLINNSNNIITYKDKDKFLNDSIVPDLRNFLR